MIKNVLTNEEIRKNHDTFVGLLKSISRDFMCEELISFLESGDFFVAPATTKYNKSYPGGLCKHSLEVYNYLIGLNESMNFSNSDSIKIVSLLHALSSIGLYDRAFRNVKVEGQWIQEDYYTIDEENKFVIGSKEETSLFLASKYIRLTDEEACAILHHLGGFGNVNNTAEISNAFSKYKLSMYLHIADLMDTYSE